jgi:hypothetical protein
MNKFEFGIAVPILRHFQPLLTLLDRDRVETLYLHHSCCRVNPDRNFASIDRNWIILDLVYKLT